MELTKSESFLRQNTLSLKLKPIFIGQLAAIESLENKAFGYIDGLFEVVIGKNETITSDFIRNYAQNISGEIFIHPDDYKRLTNQVSSVLTKITRSLSIGDPLKNSSKHTNLLSLQMATLYKNPFDDELLLSQFQSSKNLSSLLYNNKGIHKDLFHNFQKQNHHYTISQPLLTSILLLSFIQHTQMFSEREIQNLFLTSYFKDIGMSFIPREKFELSYLSLDDKNLFADHAKTSMEILNGRIPLNKTHLNIIENHHFLNHVIQSKAHGKEVDINDFQLTGVESILLSAIDILVAATSQRPYREAQSIFKALEVLKRVISEDYPQEYRSLVFFIKQFYKK